MTDHSQKRNERIQLMLDEVELEAIDTWRFANRLPSRAAAIRELKARAAESGAGAAGYQGREDVRLHRDPGPLEDG
jgi:hypothetical protein